MATTMESPFAIDLKSIRAIKGRKLDNSIESSHRAPPA
jgi:hypothetical protein